MLPLLQRKRSGQAHFRPSASRRYGYGRALVNSAGRLRLATLVLLGLFLAALGPIDRAQAAPRILALGDSLTAGFGLPPEEAFPVRLQARLATLGVKAEVVNAGVSGDTSAGGLARLDWSLADRPDCVLVELGANDALRGIDPKVTYGNIDKILARLKAAGVKVLLLGMRAPGNWGREYQQEFDAIYPKLAATYGVPLYPFFLDGVALDANLSQGDGLHPNARGVEVVVDRIAPYVVRLVQGRAGQG